MLNHCDQELQEQQNWWLVRLVRLVMMLCSLQVSLLSGIRERKIRTLFLEHCRCRRKNKHQTYSSVAHLSQPITPPMEAWKRFNSALARGLGSCSRPGNGCIFHVCNFPAENFRPWRVPIPGIDDAAPSAQRSLLFHSRHENQTVRVPGKVGPCLKSPCRCNSRPQSFDHHFLITFTRPQLYGQNIEELDVLCDSFSKSFFWVGCLCSWNEPEAARCCKGTARTTHMQEKRYEESLSSARTGGKSAGQKGLISTLQCYIWGPAKDEGRTWLHKESMR